MVGRRVKRNPNYIVQGFHKWDKRNRELQGSTDALLGILRDNLECSV